ncbi:hypothetical protein VTK73DRAFT_3666 [Phialemonium thermophilum]|uniref:F-box domain-containing protein n=1 Tax=Phialemonium thermophilum TaxID=223376 RepID=A0ABR3VG14_9PEZI
MPRRPTAKARALGASSAPTPVHSNYTTPLSSAYPSTYASEAEWDPDDEVSRLPLSRLVLQDFPPDDDAGAAANCLQQPHQPGVARAASQTFRFMDLPSELRLKIYGFHFEESGPVVDLDPDNYKRIHKKLALLRVCRTVYHEASHYFYSTRTFRVFPTCPGRFFKTKRPLLARLNARQRACITSLELRLGPGWNKPPRGWVVNDALGLADCVNVRFLTVFVECDPSDNVFKGFRKADGFYEGFSRNLLNDVLGRLPFLERVYFDAWKSVKKSGAMMRGLFEVAVARGRRICWGPERGWTDQDDDDDDEGGHDGQYGTARATMVAAGGPNVLVAAA